MEFLVFSTFWVLLFLTIQSIRCTWVYKIGLHTPRQKAGWVQKPEALNFSQWFQQTIFDIPSDFQGQWMVTRIATNSVINGGVLAKALWQDHDMDAIKSREMRTCPCLPCCVHQVWRVPHHQDQIIISMVDSIFVFLLSSVSGSCFSSS